MAARSPVDDNQWSVCVCARERECVCVSESTKTQRNYHLSTVSSTRASYPTHVLSTGCFRFDNYTLLYTDFQALVIIRQQVATDIHTPLCNS